MMTRISLLFLAMAVSACADAPTATRSESMPVSVQSVGRNGVISGEALLGLTSDNELVTFESGKPNQTTSVVAINGLANGEMVVGIDFRPSDRGTNSINDLGKLYAVTTASRLYTIDPVTGNATNPVTLFRLNTVTMVRTQVLLNGTAFGVGFNPQADRLRIHSNTNQNLRINVETGLTIVDGVLAYAAGDVNAGMDADVTATGYTNNDNDPATPTELYAIDTARDVLVELASPNNGLLTTVGALGVDAGLMTGFDISNSSRLAYAVMGTSASRKSTLYTVDLDTGVATSLGLLAQSKGALLSIAVKP